MKSYDEILHAKIADKDFAATWADALQLLKDLQEENVQLKEELTKYKALGRKKHDDKWKERYEEFVVKYESGESLVEIVENSSISRRTAYRYKAYYDELNKKKLK